MLRIVSAFLGRSPYTLRMTLESNQLLAAARKHVALNNTFCPIEIGRKAGLTEPQAQLAARALANHGILTLGFDYAAAFTPDYRKANSKTEKVPAKAAKGTRGRKPKLVHA